MAGALSVPQAGLAAPGSPVRIDAEHFPYGPIRAAAVQHDGSQDGLAPLPERISVHGETGQAEAAAPVILGLADGESSFDVTQLDPDFAEGTVSALTGATLEGTVLHGLAPGQRVTYTYTDNVSGCSGDCILDFRKANAWTEEPSIESWAVGSAEGVPSAAALHGEVVFTYSNGAEPFREKAPTSTGHYLLRAVVEPDDEYAGLQADVPFLIVPEGVDPKTASEAPALLEATYGDTLADVELPEGYTWRDPAMSVGVVGINRFQAIYDADGSDQIVSLNVRVLPRNGDTLDISPIENEYEANHIVIKDGDVTLVKGTDYMITNSVEGDEVTVTIHFMGNYTGEVVRQFTFDLENAWIIPLTAPGWTYGTTPNLPQAEARYGETVYTYAAVTDPDAAGGGTVGEFTQAAPENAGTYVVRAVVPSTIYYTGLSAEERFVIAKANPTYELPTGIAAYYTTQLQAIALPEGFSFVNPTETVGNVGEHTFEALYTPADTANYNTVPVQIQVTVLPKNGSNFQVDQITTEAQAENPVVRDGNTVLTKNTDYTVTIQRNGTQLTLIINFIGNYTGQLVRTYTITQTGGNNQNTTTTGTGTTKAPGTDDSSDLGRHIAWLLASGGVAAGSMYLLRRKRPSRRRSGI